MKQRRYIAVLLLLAFTVGLSAFQFSANEPGSRHADTIAFIVPANFPAPTYSLKVSKAGFELGKTLFYDQNLSADRTISCANCHQASAAFANLNRALSTGVKQCKGSRNAPPLFNLAWQKEFMWDGRINTMLAVPVNAITNACEMGTSMQTVLATLNNDTAYRSKFKAAFGEDHINADDLLDALGQFTAMLISANSKYDKIMRREGNFAFTANEQQGYVLFKQKCAACHSEPLFTDFSYRNNGLDEHYNDAGRDSLTHSIIDVAKFRVPTLRNIEITGPYMHDGRFHSLKQVLAHYNSGIKKHSNLDPVFRQNNQLGIELSTTQQLQLIAFLKTLTDIDFINDRRFNNN